MPSVVRGGEIVEDVADRCDVVGGDEDTVC